MHRQQSSEFSTTNDWQRWCRLCAKRDGTYFDVFHRSTGQEMIANMNITDVIKDYFQIHIKQDAQLPLLICTECCNTITSLESYAEHIKKVQKMYEDLKNADNSDMDIKDLYYKFGIVKCEVFVPQSLPGSDSSTTTSGIEEIFVDTIGQEVSVKDEEMDETELKTQTVQNKAEIKIEIPDPFDNGKLKIPECTQINLEDSDVDDRESNKNYASSMEDFENEIKSMRHKESGKNSHAPKDTKNANYTCYICRQRFVQNRNYVGHMKSKHEIDVPLYNCQQCQEKEAHCSFRRKKDLDRHIKKVHEPTVYPCPHCERKFKGKKVAENHIRIEHEGEGTFICEECGESVRTKERLVEHMAIHTGGAFECKDCGKRFARKNYLKKHLEIHGDKHICGECGAKLTTSKALKYHMKVHSDEMPYKCNYCGRRFKRTKNLKNHLITHTGLKPYSCDFCDKTFSTGSSCRYHKKHLHPKELAAMEAAGVKSYTKNIPKMHVLKAM
ncbi:zinc finger protein OZF-like isoform X2 [Eurosta solidaginis]|uniref:zinc finger protein OZF-like isoform X2 n=1 Tax=Eurosta solidaginis TaxID=178769 RepID=UPI0035317D04